MITLDGVEHQLDVNENGNQLHGGSRGFDRLVWSVVTDESTGTVTFSVDSPDGDQGYPGSLRATTTYEFDASVLRIRMTAVADAATIVNLVHHTYWNLAGHDHRSVLDHELMIDADSYTPVDHELLPTGEIRSVDGTRFDFREPRPIGRGAGLDHNWVLRGPVGSLHPAAVLRDPSSGRVMTLETSEPGLQVYTGQGLGADLVGKSGSTYRAFSGVAMDPRVNASAMVNSNVPGKTPHSNVAGFTAVLELKPGNYVLTLQNDGSVLLSGTGLEEYEQEWLVFHPTGDPVEFIDYWIAGTKEQESISLEMGTTY